MKPLLHSLFPWVGFAVLAVAAPAAGDWRQLKEGMTSDEIVRIVGEPLLRLKARGVERWIYDGSGEVVFYDGPVRFWTAATPSPAAQAKPVASDVMFRPTRPQRLLPARTPPPAYVEPTAADGARFRYR